MKVWARYYSTETREYYRATCKRCSCIDDGIRKVKRFLATKKNIDISRMINTSYGIAI